jgi:hypothetical protein
MWIKREEFSDRNIILFIKLEDGTIDFKIGKQSGESQLDSVLNNLTEFMKNMTKLATTGGVSTP